MKLTFIDARRVISRRDRFDFQYFYTVDEENNVHKIHVVTSSHGAELAWNIKSEQDLHEYSKIVFPLVITFMKAHWQEHHKLPEENQEYFEKRELILLGKTKIDWKNYVLELD